MPHMSSDESGGPRRVASQKAVCNVKQKTPSGAAAGAGASTSQKHFHFSTCGTVHPVPVDRHTRPINATVSHQPKMLQNIPHTSSPPLSQSSQCDPLPAPSLTFSITDPRLVQCPARYVCRMSIYPPPAPTNELLF